MKESRFFYVPEARTSMELPADEAVHALRVLRMKAGDELFLMDGQGTFFKGEVTLASSKHCGYRILEEMPQQKTWNGNIHLAIAPTKMMERVEWMVEKCTEIGFDKVSFLNTKWSERKSVRTDRVEKIVIAAAKQSRKAWMPVVSEMVSFGQFLQADKSGKHFIAHCYPEIERKDLFTEIQKLSQDEDITVLVGPEGDFSKDEVEQAIAAGYVSVSLGNSRLRTETAGLMAVTMAQIVKRK